MLNIIMPIHNTNRRLFDRAIASVLTQTKRCLLTVVDDCSDEEYSNYYKEVCDKKGLGYLRTPSNVGPGGARQYGIDKGYTNTDYIAFLDSDDILLPQFVEILTSEIQRTNSDVMIGMIIHQGKDHTTDNNIPTQVLGTWLHGKVYKRSYLEKNNIRFLDNIKCNEDVYFNNLALKLSKKVKMIEKDVYLWCNNQDSITRSISNREFYDKYNKDFFYAGLYSFEKILNNHQEFLDSTHNIYSQIYNSYHYEKEIGHDTTKLDEDLRRVFSNFDLYQQSEKYYKVVLQSSATHMLDVCFTEGLKSWIERLQGYYKEVHKCASSL